MTITKIALSKSTDGKMIQSVGGLPTQLHVASAVPTDIDEVWIWACNVHSADVSVDIGWGIAGSSATNNTFTVPKEAGLYLMVPGLVFKGNSGGYPNAVTSTVTTSNQINLVGYVNRHSV